MIEIFYYIGLLCLASCIEEVVNIKRLKKVNDLSNEIINDNSEIIDGIKSKAEAGEFIDSQKELSSSVDVYKKAVKKTNPIRTIIGLIALFWNIVGVFISEQKIFFVVLLLITFVSPYIIRSITKDDRQQIILGYITSIVSLVFISVICYNHFFKGVM